MSIFDLFHSKNYLDSINEKTDQAPRRAGQISRKTATPKVEPRNKRKYSRHESLFSTKIRHQKHRLSATVINYSETGLGMLVDEPMKLNDSIELQLEPRGGKPVVLQAKIKRCLNMNNKFMVGAQIGILGGEYANLFRQMDVYGIAQPSY